ncbi:DIP1984 family protein [Melaminivora jejuensis]|uniref:DIP1984 family protein n=1 Tax=Melaminivora jejuensis TaxID=1267217 RepID=UPI001ADFF286|nr:DIP1984 family protein [Melaminivora jejuensis]UHJ63750.1 DIP1984 family protein [Melaminivora jejuensis]
MQLAEALLIRADQNKKILSLRARIAHNALAQEGDAPQEDVAALLAECFAVIEQQRLLVQRINAANASARLPDGRPLAQVLGEREALAQRHAVLTQAVEATRQDTDRYSMREIKWVPQLDVPATQRQIEDLARQLRELNIRLQEANWQVTLPEV